MDIFQATTRPEESLHFRHPDPDDRRMGEFVKSDPPAYEEADIVILGYPEDEGVRRNKGRPGTRKAPAAIRRAFYRLAAPQDIGTIKLFDLGDLHTTTSLEESHDLQAKVVEQLFQDGKRVVVLGGGNDVSYPDCRALAKGSGSILAFNIDSHFDVRAVTPRNSGTPYRQLLEENILQAGRFYEMGNKPFANSPVYERYLREQGVHIYSLEELRRQGMKALFERILTASDAAAIFWGFDLDSVQAGDAPGVSAPSPLGLSAEEICRIAEAAGADRRTKMVELTEVNPVYDLDGRTSKLAALIVYYYLSSVIDM